MRGVYELLWLRQSFKANILAPWSRHIALKARDAEQGGQVMGSLGHPWEQDGRQRNR